MSPCPMRLWCLLPVEGAGADMKHEIFSWLPILIGTGVVRSFRHGSFRFFSVLVKKKSPTFIDTKKHWDDFLVLS